jgi:hypothetical protein
MPDSLPDRPDLGQGLRLPRRDPVARALVDAIHAGEVEPLAALLREHPGLAAARIVDDNGASGTPLHAAADWPGFFPHGPEVVAMLIEAGADPAPRWRAAGTPKRRCTGRRAATTSTWPGR